MRTPLHLAAAGFAATVLALAPPSTAQKMTYGDLTMDFSDPALAPRRPVEITFVARLRAATNTADTAALRALVHPASLACFETEAGRLFIANRMKRDTAEAIPDTAKVVLVPFKDIFASSPKAAGLTWLPLTPTAMLGVDYKIEERDGKGVLTRQRGRTIVRPVVEQDGRMLLVEYCLTEEGERRLLAVQAKPGPP